MKTQFFARRELGIEGKLFKPGQLVAELESPDGVEPNRIVSAIAKGLLDTTPPAAVAKGETAGGEGDVDAELAEEV